MVKGHGNFQRWLVIEVLLAEKHIFCPRHCSCNEAEASGKRKCQESGQVLPGEEIGQTLDGLYSTNVERIKKEAFAERDCYEKH